MVAAGAEEFIGMACLQWNKSEFIDTTGRRRTLVASRFAGTCSGLRLAIALFSV
jgi:hypothetical protein